MKKGGLIAVAWSPPSPRRPVQNGFPYADRLHNHWLEKFKNGVFDSDGILLL